MKRSPILLDKRGRSDPANVNRRIIQSVLSLRNMRRARDPSPQVRVSGKVSDTQGSSEESLPVKYHPVDRGWAWIIMIGVFVIHFFTTGYLRSFGLMFVEFQNYFQSSSTITAAMSGTQMLAYSIGTFVTMNVLMKFISVKTSCLIGCCMELMSVAGNSLVTDIRQLIFTHGILFGFGQALIYCPAMVILSEYFDKRRPLATVFATGGVSAGGIVMPFLMQYLFNSYGLIGGVLILAGVIFQQTIFISFFTSPSEYAPAGDINNTESCGGNGVCELISQKSAPNGTIASVVTEDGGTANTQDGKYFHKGSKHEGSNDHVGLHETVCRNSIGHKFIPLDDNNPKFQVSDSSHSLVIKEADNSPYASLYPHENDYHQVQSNNLHSHEADEEKNHGQKSSLYPKMNLKETKNENHHEFVSVGNAVANSSEQTSKQPLLDVSHGEVLHASKSSINSAHSFAHRTEQDGADHGREKTLRPPLHTLAFPSDTLVRAMSTSSVDVLGSAHHMSFISSTHSIRKRGTGYSVERCSEPGGRMSTRYSENARLRLRLPTCAVPEMVRRPAFWFVAVFFCCGGLASVLPTAFFPALSESRGMEASSSSHFLVASAIMEMLGRLVPGLILHFGYMRPSTAVIPSMALCGILLQLVHFFNDFMSLMVLSCLIGFFTGAFWAMQVLVVIEIIGMEFLGKAFGFYSIILGCGVGSGFPIAGAMFDATGTYNVPYNFFGATYLLASLMMVLVQFTRRPEDPDSSEQGDDDDSDDEDEDQEKSISAHNI